MASTPNGAAAVRGRLQHRRVAGMLLLS